MKYKIKEKNDLDSVISYLGHLDFSKCPGGYVVEIKRKKDKRTTEANALYWLWVTIISEHVGYATPVEIHESIVRDVFGEFEKSIGDLRISVRMSSTEMDTKEFNKLMKRAEEIALFLEISLPFPEDRYE